MVSIEGLRLGIGRLAGALYYAEQPFAFGPLVSPVGDHARDVVGPAHELFETVL